MNKPVVTRVFIYVTVSVVLILSILKIYSIYNADANVLHITKEDWFTSLQQNNKPNPTSPPKVNQVNPLPAPTVIRTPKYCTLLNLKASDSNPYDCIVTKTIPPFIICIHNVTQDIHVSGSLKARGTWEHHILLLMGAYFQKYPTAGLLDIGGNIGFYSLYAAQLGRAVVAVEPFPDNYNRIRRSVALGQLQSKFTLVINPLTNVRTSGNIKLEQANNQGSYYLNVDGKPCSANCSGPQTILISDLLEVIPFNISIIKMDIQGQEARTLQNVDALLDKVYVPVIFMEWILYKAMYVSESHRSTEKDFILSMLQILTKRGYKPWWSNQFLDLNKWNTWPYDILFRHSSDL